MDIIGSLDDYVLVHILSFLFTKDSVGTGVLSKRWISLWKSVPRLDLFDFDFDYQNQNLVNFGNSFFEHNPGNLDKFTLMMDCEEHEDHYEPISAWVRNLLSLKPKEVNLQLYELEKCDFCSGLFNCVTIETMSLCLNLSGDLGRTWSINPSVVNLPFLKKIKVSSMDFNDEFLEKLVLGCPILQEMVLNFCLFNVTKRIRPYSVQTLRMTLVACSENARFPVFENLKSLYICEKWNSINKGFEPLTSFLKCTPNLKELTLLGVKLQRGVKIRLDKVMSLNIGDFELDDAFEPLMSFLKCAPNLQKLTLTHVKVEKLRTNVEAIRLDRLKTVQIECCKGDQGACIVANYFMTHVTMIKSIQINPQERKYCRWCDCKV